MLRSSIKVVSVAIVSLVLTNTPTIAANPADEACTGTTGAGYGLCVSAFHLGCGTEAEENGETCTKIEDNYLKITGEMPPWLEPPVLCDTGNIVCGSGDNGLCIAGECFVEVLMAAGESGNSVCAAEGLTCVDVPVLSPPEEACLAFHPTASVSSDVNGWKEGVYCDTGDTGLACGGRTNDCHDCPACGDNLSCGTANSEFLTALYAKCVE